VAAAASPQPQAPAFQPAPPPAPSPAAGELPGRYGDHFIYLMIRDPYWLYAYWEIRKEVEERALRELGSDWNAVRSILRVYHIADRGRAPGYFDVALRDMAEAWYLEVQPNSTYVVEIGLLHRDGRFIALARSNEVTTPRSGMSEILDENWMGIDFDKMYALSGGFEVGKSSQELRRLMEERLRGAITSGSGGASPVRPPENRGFWFAVDCELIVYGATEPDARVTIQGKPIALRPDGTFTLRYALPDGRIAVEARAVSADGAEERTVIPIVERRTRRPAPAALKGAPAEEARI
jgi:hypothetical protein